MSLVRRPTARQAAVAATAAGALLNYVTPEGVRSATRAAFNYAKRSSKRRRTAKRRTAAKRLHFPMPYKKLRKTSTRCKVKKLCKFMNQQQATHVHRYRSTAQYTVSNGQQTVTGSVAEGTNARLEAAMATLRYFDPATNSLVVANPTSGTYQRDISVRIYRRVTMKNNTNAPVRVEIYSCLPKVDTSIEPVTAFVNGLADQGAPSTTSPLVRFKDSIQLKDLWNCKLVKKTTLQPSQTISATKWHKSFDYNFALIDVHALEYQKKYGGHYWAFVLNGVIVHDATTKTLVAQGRGDVDCQFDTAWTFTYDAGKDLHNISVFDASPAIGSDRYYLRPDGNFHNETT